VSDPYYVVDRQERAGVEVLRLSGDLDINARADITDAICAAATTGRPIEVDLAGVGFLDSEGLAGLIEGWTAAQAAGREFRMTGARDVVLQVLTVSGVLDVFNRP
jgi:anti-sigma B factor antagonist